ncbi:MAG: phage tail protein [Acidobacteria bacterium]|nr:phage tail protein [Acidobacteriota bacterium]
MPVVFHFRVSFGPDTEDGDGRFQEVSGLTAEVSVEEYREGGLNVHAHRLPTGAKYGNLVLKRGYMSGTAVEKWCREAIEQFVFAPKDIDVVLLNEEHQPLAQWSFTRAYPVKWSLSDLKAQDNAIAIESIELAYRSFAYQSLEKKSPG